MDHPRFNRLYKLSQLDQASRTKIERWTMAITFLYGVLNTLVLRRPEHRVTIETVIVLICCISFYYYRYCFQRSALVPRITEEPDSWFTFGRRPLLVRVAAIASGLLLILARRSSIDTLQAAVVEERLKRISTGKLTREKLNQVDEISNSSRKLGIKVRPSLVSELAQKCIAVAKTDSNDSALAWQAAQSCINYRQFLISPPSPTNVQESYVAPVSASRVKSWDLYASRGKGTPFSQAAGFGPFPLSVISVDNYCWSDTLAGMSIYEPIGLDRNKDITNGPCGLQLNGNGGYLEIDGLSVKHIIYHNLRLVYHGGPVVLEDVRFTDCLFFIEHNPAGLALEEKLLASHSLTFDFTTPPVNK